MLKKYLNKKQILVRLTYINKVDIKEGKKMEKAKQKIVKKIEKEVLNNVQISP